MGASKFKMWYTTWVWHVAYQETMSRTKIGGFEVRGVSQKNLGHLLISATTEASNFKFHTQLAFGEQCTKKQCLGPTLAGLGLGEPPKRIWDPLLISATVEVSNFKFDMQLLFWEYLTKKQRLGWTVVGGWAREAS